MGDISEDDKSLMRSENSTGGMMNGRGIVNFNMTARSCLCQRPYTHILCLNCGHFMFGRVRYTCPIHVTVTFLIDITNCSNCHCHEFMLNEININNMAE